MCILPLQSTQQRLYLLNQRQSYSELTQFTFETRIQTDRKHKSSKKLMKNCTEKIKHKCTYDSSEMEFQEVNTPL